ncbi:MAG: DUF362 domain-containing protein [Deltaproteobacteria bacterium]|nr:DUF362 domain-containing protein [Deltaproteobacteria bacterium]
MPKVFLSKIKENIDSTIAKLLEETEFSKGLQGDSILIKPNLFEPVSYTTGQTTNPNLVGAVIKCCFAQGAKEVCVGEGPSYFLSEHALKECFIKTGVAEVVERCQARWILFDEHNFKTYRDVSPFLPKEFGISEHAFAYNKIINLPVPKTHYLTGVSIAMKNLKGFLRRADKPLFHRIGINEAVVELNKIIEPSLNIADFTSPAQKHSGFILAGNDRVAVDTVATSLMGLNPDEIKTIQLGYQAGLGEKNIVKIDIKGEDVKGLKMRYELPSEWLERKFPLLKIRGHDTACSGCLIPLFSSLAQIAEQGKSLKKPLTIILGTSHDASQLSDVIFMGDCTMHKLERGSQAKGCPPQKEDILKVLYEHIQDNY